LIRSLGDSNEEVVGDEEYEDFRSLYEEEVDETIGDEEYL
jgi:hypothetical protein